MKSSIVRSLAVIAVFGGLIMASGARAIDLDKISIDGQVRLRSEFDRKLLSYYRHHRIYHDLRTRLGVRVDPTDWTFVYLQLQNSQRLGEPSSGELTDSAVVNMHQAYFELHDLVFHDIWLRAGRFELVYGNQRVFGSDGWGNVGRVWDGARLSFVSNGLRVDAFYLKRKELNSAFINRDFDVTGVYSIIRPIGLDLFWFYELDANMPYRRDERLHRHNIGCFFQNRSPGRTLDITAQGNYQLGRMDVLVYPLGGLEDISAIMLNSEIGLSFFGRLPGRAKIGVDYTSGDNPFDSSTAGTYSAYSNDYYSYHRFQGYMDLFSNSPIYGIVDVYTGVEFDPDPDWMAAVDIHYFRAADYYLIGKVGSGFTKDLGTEIDLTSEYESNRGAIFTGGFSMFFPQGEYAPYHAVEKRTGLWGYVMVTVNF